MSYSVVIPSKNAANLVACAEAVRQNEPATEIVVIDDGVDWKAAAETNVIGDHLRAVAETGRADLSAAYGLRVIRGIKPFIFARNCNLGIKNCAEDVILLNDDAMLKTPFGFYELEQASKARPEFGVISAVTDVVGNSAQRPKDLGLRIESRVLAFVCVYIPARTIKTVGLLDERFTAYGWEDNDYCRRVREAGMKLGILDDCFVDHSSLTSTFRGGARVSGDIGAGREIYRQKWGDTA